MDRSQTRHGNWKMLATGIAAFVAIAGMQPAGQAPVGAAGRPPAQRERAPVDARAEPVVAEPMCKGCRS